MSRLLPIVLFAAACTAASAAPDPCSAGALGMSNAVPLVAWNPPPGCVLQHPPARTIVTSQADLDAMFRCKQGAATPQLDFTHASLVVVTWQLSLATSTIDAVDDGNTVTMIAKARPACANQSRPPPMAMTSYFVIASANASRNFGDASCTMQTGC